MNGFRADHTIGKYLRETGKIPEARREKRLIITEFPDGNHHANAGCKIGENGFIFIDLVGFIPYIIIPMRCSDSPQSIPVVNGVATKAGRDLNLVHSPGNC
jgi:hypothetical protein